MKMLMATAAFLVAGAAQATVTNYYTTLASDTGGTGTGSVTASFDDATNVFTFFADFSGLTGNTTQSHFHCCTATPLAGTAIIAVDSPTLPIPLGVKAGSFGASLDLDDLDGTGAAVNFNPGFVTVSGGLAPAIAAFKAGMDSGRAYLNVHTSFKPGGEIRGFMLVPEPASAALVLAALVALGTARAGRRSD